MAAEILRAVVGWQLRLGDSAFERHVHCGLSAVISFSEGDDRSVGHRVAAAVTQGLCLSAQSSVPRPGAHLQSAWISGHLLYDARTRDIASTSRKLCGAFFRCGVHLVHARPVACGCGPRLRQHPKVPDN